MSRDARNSHSARRGGGIIEFLILLAVSFALVFGFVRPVVASPVFIDSGSMIPTLMVHDHLLINKLADDLSEPVRGDIVLFEDPNNGPDPLIKRVVGLPGEAVELRAGRLFVDGERVGEPYTARPRVAESFGPVRVPEGSYFVMGDNRGNSLDSRVFGPVAREDLIGETLFRFWPPTRLGLT